MPCRRPHIRNEVVYLKQALVNMLAMPDIDGGLIGGASLKPADFLAIGKAANA